MLKYLCIRCLTALLVVLGVSTLVFMLIHIVPGDPIEVMLGESAQPADAEALRNALGLNLPLYRQWLNFMSNLGALDLGTSLHSHREIAALLWERMPATLALACTSLAIAISIAFPLGIVAAVRRGSRWDLGAMTFSMLGISIPGFWLGPLLIMIFSLWL